MKILVMLSLIFNMTYVFSQENKPITMLTDEEYKKSQQISPQISQLMEEMEKIVDKVKGNKNLNPNNALDIATVLALEFTQNTQDVNDELLSKLCGETNWDQKDDSRWCHDPDLYDELQSKTDMDIMHDPRLKVNICDSNLNDGNTIFCFDETNIKRNSQNQIMMGYLCTNERIPTPNVRVAFGSCDIPSEKISNGEMSCNCQEVRGNKVNGLAWHCTDFGK